MNLKKIKSGIANFIVPKVRKAKQWQREHFDESKGKKLYKADPPKINSIQKKIVADLDEYGISIISINDLFPDGKWWNRLQREAFDFVKEPEVQEFAKRFKNYESIKGFATDNYAKKYLYRKYNIDKKKAIDFKDSFLGFGIEEKILDIVGSYFQRYGKLRMIDLWYNLAIGDREPTQSQNWHRDGEDTHLVKVFLYFNDVDPEAGPFTYVPESHLKGKYSMIFPGETVTKHKYGGIYPDRNKFLKEFSEEDVKVCTGKAGTLIFCDTYGLHRGGNCKTKDRIIGNWVYTTPSSFCENTTPYQNPGKGLLTAKQKFALSF